MQTRRNARFLAHGAWEVEEGAPGRRFPPAPIHMAANGLEICLEGLPPGFGELGVVRGGFEVGFGRG